jgi:hypothetical protein
MSKRRHSSKKQSISAEFKEIANGKPVSRPKQKKQKTEVHNASPQVDTVVNMPTESFPDRSTVDMLISLLLPQLQRQLNEANEDAALLSQVKKDLHKDERKFFLPEFKINQKLAKRIADWIRLKFEDSPLSLTARAATSEYYNEVYHETFGSSTSFNGSVVYGKILKLIQTNIQRLKDNWYQATKKYVLIRFKDFGVPYSLFQALKLDFSELNQEHLTLTKDFMKDRTGSFGTEWNEYIYNSLVKRIKKFESEAILKVIEQPE